LSTFWANASTPLSFIWLFRRWIDRRKHNLSAAASLAIAIRP
jgi:hypothetical protein